MKTIILYGSKYGCTQECAKILAENLEGERDIYDVSSKEPLDIAPYNKVVIGGPIYAGSMLKSVKNFCTQHLSALKEKKLGLFICCMWEGEKGEEQLEEAFPKELLERAIAKDFFGGAIQLEKMNFFNRMVVKVVAKTSENSNNVSQEKIKEFAQLLNRA